MLGQDAAALGATASLDQMGRLTDSEDTNKAGKAGHLLVFAKNQYHRGPRNTVHSELVHPARAINMAVASGHVSDTLVTDFQCHCPASLLAE